MSSSDSARTTLFVARHGEAAYESDLVSDAGGWLTPTGRRHARALGGALRGEGVVSVWTSPLSRAVQTAELAAAVLDVDDVVVREDLREYGVGALEGRAVDEGEEIGPVLHAWSEGDDGATIPGGERVGDIAARMHGVLEEAATTHRGRAVLLVSHGGAILTAVPVFAGRPRLSAHTHTLSAGRHLTLEHTGAGQAWHLADHGAVRQSTLR